MQNMDVVSRAAYRTQRWRPLLFTCSLPALLPVYVSTDLTAGPERQNLSVWVANGFNVKVEVSPRKSGVAGRLKLFFPRMPLGVAGGEAECSDCSQVLVQQIHGFDGASQTL